MKFKLVFVLLTILFLISNAIYGQEEKTIHFGIHINPKYTIQIFDEPDLAEGKSSFNFSFGLDYYYYITSRLQLKTGLSYFYLRSDQLDFFPVFGCDLDLPAGDFLPKKSFIEDRLNLHYIGLPLSLKMKLNDEENHVYLRGGLEIFFRIANTNESLLFECGVHSANLTTDLTSTPRSVYLNSNLGIGYEFGMTKKVKLYFEPNIEYSLNRLIEDTGFLSSENNNRRHLQIGLITGIRF